MKKLLAVMTAVFVAVSSCNGAGIAAMAAETGGETEAEVTASSAEPEERPDAASPADEADAESTESAAITDSSAASSEAAESGQTAEEPASNSDAGTNTDAPQKAESNADTSEDAADEVPMDKPVDLAGVTADADGIVSVALSQEGYTEGSGNSNKYGAYYGRNGESWCGFFIMWCRDQAGISKSVIPDMAGVYTAYTWYSNMGLYHARGSGYTPKKGDLVIYNWGTTHTYAHIELVYSASGGKFSSIGGNTGGGDKVATHGSYSASESDITGFCEVNYSGTPVQLTNPWSYSGTPGGTYGTNLVNKSYSEVKWIQAALNIIQSAGLTVDGYYGNGTKNAVTTFQRNYGLTVDGSAGPQTIGKMVSELNNRGYYAPNTDTTGPVISDIKVSDISQSGYTVSCTATDDSGIDRVQFPTWTALNDQDDIFSDWANNTAASGTRNGNTFTYRVRTSDHNNETGDYCTHIYAYDTHGNSSYVGLSHVTVPVDVRSISVAPSSVTLAKPGDTQQLSAAVKPDNATDKTVTWSSDNENVATVNSSGLVTAVAAGTAVITAKTSNGITASSTVTIGTAVPDGTVTEGYFTYQICNGEATLTKCDRTISGDIKIPAETQEGVPVISIGECSFEYCSGLTSVEIPNGVTDIGDAAFSECTNLNKVNIPSSVVSIGHDAFFACNLISVNVPASVTNIGNYAFSRCGSMKQIIVEENNPFYMSKDGVLYNKDMTRLITFPGGKEGSFSIPDSVTTIEECAFQGCGKLSGVKIPAGVDTISECAFYDSSLNSIEIPNSVKSIESDAFLQCSSLTSVKIPNSVNNIGSGAFSGCKNITSVTIPEGVTVIESATFDRCYSLININIPDSVTSIGKDAFYYCSSLTEIKIPDSVVSLGNNVFSFCENLSSIKIPNGVENIGADSFRGCRKLTTIEIPSTVTDVGNCAFFLCDGLKDIYYSGNEEQWHTISISEDKNDPLTNATVHYSSSMPVPTASPTQIFSDVTNKKSFLYKSVTWASENNIVLGFSDGKFYPNDSCTRGQAFAFLWRLAGRPSPKTKTSPFRDVTSASPFYKAILWGYENNLVKGYGDKTFRPDNTCTRSDIMLFLWRYAGKPSASSSGKSFSDVSASASNARSILWGADAGITTGYSDGTFRPNNKCTRGQIVQFLYRYAHLK